MEMGSATVASELGSSRSLPIGVVQTLLNCIDQGLLVSERSGRIVLANLQGKECLATLGHPDYREVNLISELLQAQSDSLLTKLETGSTEVQLEIISSNSKFLATLQWIPEQEWIVLQFEPLITRPSADVATQLTVQELLQEREITYRNLLAAYLKLQEVNRQKTVFLASAAHELKTPLAVIKGYYDLLLAGSLGRLTEKQKDILEESKESCERLVRLVSMFLNYSALESGKLVLQLRENDLRDCLDEMAKRWAEAFQRK